MNLIKQILMPLMVVIFLIDSKADQQAILDMQMSFPGGGEFNKIIEKLNNELMDAEKSYLMISHISHDFYGIVSIYADNPDLESIVHNLNKDSDVLIPGIRMDVRFHPVKNKDATPPFPKFLEKVFKETPDYVKIPYTTAPARVFLVDYSVSGNHERQILVNPDGLFILTRENLIASPSDSILMWDILGRYWMIDELYGINCMSNFFLGQSFDKLIMNNETKLFLAYLQSIYGPDLSRALIELEKELEKAKKLRSNTRDRGKR